MTEATLSAGPIEVAEEAGAYEIRFDPAEKVVEVVFAGEVLARSRRGSRDAVAASLLSAHQRGPHGPASGKRPQDLLSFQRYGQLLACEGRRKLR
jgi:hypothetical protein